MNAKESYGWYGPGVFNFSVFSISDFEDEREVLILPETLFHVTKVNIDEVSGQHTIYLENLATKEIFTLLKRAQEAWESRWMN